MCCVKSKNEEEDDNLYIEVPNPNTSSRWTIGTAATNGVWLNVNDKTGLIMFSIVWFLLIYSAVVFHFMSESLTVNPLLSLFYQLLVVLTLASHAKVALTDPGTVGKEGKPLSDDKGGNLTCSRCETFKPPKSHHCRICNRCVSRMDHHCPWCCNCVGVGNFKHFILFLTYAWLVTVYALLLLGYNYFFCTSSECEFAAPLVYFVRVMNFLHGTFFIFISSMLMNVTYGIITGIGTIDRMKKKMANTMHLSDEAPILLVDIFGVGHPMSWLLPVDPIFEDYDDVMGFRGKSF
jgi:hypothetical protein